MTVRRLPATWAVLLVAAWLAGVGNLALWRRLDAIGALSWPLGATLALLALGGVAALLALFAWRWTFKPVAVGLLLLSAFATHFMLAYGVVLDPGMLASVLQTDVHEAAGLFSGRLVAVVVGLGVVPALLLVRWPLAYATPPRQALRNAALLVASLGVVVGAALAGFQPLASVMRNHRDVRYLVNPLASLYSLGRAASRPFESPGAPLVAVGTDAHLVPGPRPGLLLLVLGETARADHFGLNGYERDTTPELAAQNVVSFREARACGTSTAASVPCMFSSLGRSGFEKASAPHEGLLDVLQRAGLVVLWIDNQSGCKGVCDRVPHVATGCAESECLDGVMLEQLDRRIAALDPVRAARGVVVVLHQMGSHGPAYAQRSPAAFKRFGPECATPSLSECSRDEVVNAYDNSIRYTDHVLASAIAWLKRRQAQADTALVYVSDHGESLGEKGLYLHGMPYAVAPDAQKHVPWVTWLSDGFQQHRHLSATCLRARADRELSHDHYFHSVLGLAGVETAAYRRELDAYEPCRGGPGVAAGPSPAGPVASSMQPQSL